MKRVITLLAITLLIGATLFAAGKKESGSTLTVGATPEPHAEFLNLIVGDLAQQGITLKVVEFTDYVTPNTAVEDGQIDANFFQHIPYLESFNEDKGYHLVNAGGIHIEPIALYSNKVTSINDLANGATIAIPNDPTNGGRALLLLQSAGLISLADGGSITATVFDIVSNKQNLKFRELEAATLPRVLGDVDAAVINGNYALPAGLKANKDGLIIEGADSPYVNVVAVKEGRENDASITALVKALQSPKIKAYVDEHYPNGEVVVVF
ncbi:MAG: MetQ/NlpA family ABC transporter substrate-binding protein [Sphaerochaetaceae bacterium]